MLTKMSNGDNIYTMHRNDFWNMDPDSPRMRANGLFKARPCQLTKPKNDRVANVVLNQPPLMVREKSEDLWLKKIITNSMETNSTRLRLASDKSQHSSGSFRNNKYLESKNEVTDLDISDPQINFFLNLLNNDYVKSVLVAAGSNHNVNNFLENVTSGADGAESQRENLLQRNLLLKDNEQDEDYKNSVFYTPEEEKAANRKQSNDYITSISQNKASPYIAYHTTDPIKFYYTPNKHCKPVFLTICKPKPKDSRTRAEEKVRSDVERAAPLSHSAVSSIIKNEEAAAIVVD